MAEVNGNKRIPHRTTITEDVNLGDAGSGVVNTMVFQLVADASWDGSVTIKGRSKNYLPGVTPPVAQPVAYIDRTTTGNTVTFAAITGVATNKIIEVDAAGLEILVSHTQGAGPVGGLTIYPVRMVG